MTSHFILLCLFVIWFFMIAVTLYFLGSFFLGVWRIISYGGQHLKQLSDTKEQEELDKELS